MKIAFVYAGQGSQFVGMGADFYAQYPTYKTTIDTLDAIYPIKEISFEGPIAALTKTSNTQPAMIGFAVGVTKLLQEAGIVPEILAGLSLGEYAALYTTGVFTEQAVMEVIAFRAQAMEAAAEGIDTAMVAILGLSLEEVQQVCASVLEGVVEVTNNNCPGQIVIGGERLAVEHAVEAAKLLGAKRCIPLHVSGPFHTSCMEPAYQALLAKFATMDFGTMEIPVVMNAIGTTLTDQDALQETLAQQVKQTVLFEDSIKKMLADGVDTIIEIGPGKVLAGFIKKVDRTVKTMSITTVEDLAVVLDFYSEQNKEEIGVE